MIAKKAKIDCELGREVLILDYRQAGLTPPAELPASVPVFNRGRHFADAVALRLDNGKLYGVIRLRPLPPVQFGDEPRILH